METSCPFCRSHYSPAAKRGWACASRADFRLVPIAGGCRSAEKHLIHHEHRRGTTIVARCAGNSKFEAPNSKDEPKPAAGNTKFKGPNSNEAPKQARGFRFGHWSFLGIWFFGIGISCRRSDAQKADNCPMDWEFSRRRL